MRLSFSGVSKSFHSGRGQVMALRDVDLAVGEGELFVLLGPSGCGKSTVLNLAAGLVKPTSGEIRFGDRVVASRDRKVFVPPPERNVAMVFQSYALYPHLDVFENIAFPLRVAGSKKPEIDQVVTDAARTLGIGDLLRVRPAELSGGQRQRVAIARALVNNPSILLADEPTGALDTATGNDIMALIARLHEQGNTIVLVTHEHDIAMHAHRVIHIRDGKVEKDERLRA